MWLGDFGLAKVDETQDLTRSGELVGTLRYMAPERFQGACDARSDIYGLGLTLYVFLEGKKVLARSPGLVTRASRLLRRHPLRAGLAVLAVLVAAAVGAWLLAPAHVLKPADLLLEDLDGDKKPDVAVANGGEFTDPALDSIAVFVNRGGGSFRNAVEVPAGDLPLSLAAADFDGDGLTDLAFSNQKSWNVWVLLRKKDGSYVKKTEFAFENYTISGPPTWMATAPWTCSHRMPPGSPSPSSETTGRAASERRSTTPWAIPLTTSWWWT